MESAATGSASVVDSLQFRHVVGHLASGVTILTTEFEGRQYGMTASSVTSLSADPPMMLACINNSVRTAAAVAGSGRFVVNVLGEEQGELAYRFAGSGDEKFRDLALVVSAEANAGQPLTYFRGGFGRFQFAEDDEAYVRIRDQVLSRVYPPDHTLLVEDLARALGVERSAAFYALTRLASDGLVRRDPERGYVITAFDVHTSEETFDARLAIELGVIELAIGSVSDEELIELRAAFERMAALLVGDRFVDFHAYLDANYAFHEFVVSLAHNPLLTTMFGRLSIKSVMTRSFGSTPVTSQLFIDVQRDLTEAFERGDAEAARRAARGYCEAAKRRVREILEHTGGRL
jgi:DNA-binding GntR family transcriptional regulator